MISIINFVAGKTFDEIKKSVVHAPWFFNVSESGSLYMLSFTDESDTSLQVVREANGVIFEKGTNNLVHWCFEKTYNGFEEYDVPAEMEKETIIAHEIYDENSRTDPDSTDLDRDLERIKDSVSIEHYIDGTLIRVYWYNETWNVGTSRSINAATSFWNGDRSFKELFYEAMENYDLSINDLDKDYCYSYILQHPEIKGMEHHSAMHVHPVNKVNLVDKQEISLTRDCWKIENPAFSVESVQEFADTLGINYMVFVKSKSGNPDLPDKRVKISCKRTREMYEMLSGPYKSIEYIYLDAMDEEPRKAEIKELFLSYSSDFKNLDNNFMSTVADLHFEYVTSRVFKPRRSRRGGKKRPRRDQKSVVKGHKKTLDDLHAEYTKTRNPVMLETVYDHLLNLEPRVLMRVIHS